MHCMHIRYSRSSALRCKPEAVESRRPFLLFIPLLETSLCTQSLKKHLQNLNENDTCAFRDRVHDVLLGAGEGAKVDLHRISLTEQAFASHDIKLLRYLRQMHTRGTKPPSLRVCPRLILSKSFFPSLYKETEQNQRKLRYTTTEQQRNSCVRPTQPALV